MSAWDLWRDGPFPAILQVMWRLNPLWLANWPSFRGQSCSRNQEKAQIELNFFIFGGLTSWFFWSHYVLKQLIGMLLLCSVRHIMVNCLRNADCWKVSPLSGTWCNLCFVNTGASHMEPRKLGKPIDYSSGMCTGNLNSQNALHVESAKQLFTTIFIPVVEHTPTLRHSMFLFLFSLFIYHSFHIWPNWFSTVCIQQFVVNEVASMAAILVTFVTVIFFFSKKKKIPGYKESLFVLDHLIHIFSIYMYYIYI